MELAEELAAQLGRGNRDIQLSVSRALIALGEAAIEPTLKKAASDYPDVHAHAVATERLLRDPNIGIQLAVNEANEFSRPSSNGTPPATCAHP